MENLEIANLTKRFGPITAVDDLSLEVREGEFVVLLGPNGAGKTTTLRCVAGLEKPDTGDIRFGGMSVNGQSAAERNVAFVFQNYALYPRKTVYDNMAFPLRTRGYPKSKIEDEVRRVASLLHIEHLLRRRPHQLSGGEQQRVALGRALVRKARIFLMDEPLTNLDFKLRVEMRTELKRLHQELRSTLFYVTNDQVEAMSMADRVAILDKGRLQQVGTPREVYDRPANLIVASFLGFPRMNLLDCVLRLGNQPELRSPTSRWAVGISETLREAVLKSGAEQLVLGIRAEDLQLVQQPVEGSLPGEVYVAEPLGDRIIVDVKVGDDIVKVKVGPTSVVNPGQPVWLVVDAGRMHVFDRESQLALI